MAQSRELGGMGRGIGPSISTRSSQLDSGTKRMVNKQNKAAESYKIKDMDKLDKNRKKYIERKQKEVDRLLAEIKAAKQTGRKQGAAATAALAVPGAVLYKKAKDKANKKKK